MKKKLINSSFLLLLWSTLLKPLYDFPDFIININIAFIHQSFSLLIIFLSFLHVLINQRIKFEYGIFLLLSMGMVTGFFGSFFSEPSFSIYLSHLFYIVMPILSIHFGILLFDLNGLNLIYKINVVASSALKILLFATFLYFIFHFYLNIWEFFGYSSGLLLAYILTDRAKSEIISWKLFIFDLFTGKRSSLALWLFLLFRKKMIYSFFLIFIVFIFWEFLKDILPERYSNVFLFDISNPILMSYATGGRSNEWFSIYDVIHIHPFGEIFGLGFGNSYNLFDPISGDFEFRHYAHMTPLTYAFIFGFPLAVILYVYLIYKSILFEVKLSFGIHSFYTIVLFLSFSGASLLVEPLPWIIFGFSHAALKMQRI